MTAEESDLRGALAHRGVQVLAELAGGHRNRVFLVARDGLRLVAKTSTRSEAALRWLAAPQALARGAGLVVPTLIADAEGRLAPGGLTLEPFVAGGAPGPALMRRVHAALARVHRLGRHLPQRPGFAAAARLGPWGQGGDAALARLPRPLAAACRRAWASVPGAPHAAIHGDAGAGNVIATPAGPALIDRDEARRDHPGFEALPSGDPRLMRARLAWEVAVCWGPEPARARRLARQLLRPAERRCVAAASRGLAARALRTNKLSQKQGRAR